MEWLAFLEWVVRKHLLQLMTFGLHLNGEGRVPSFNKYCRYDACR